jgi:magnesium chelatase subunit I
MNIDDINTFGELKKSGYKPLPIKDEMRKNLINCLKENKKPFEGIIGYDETVIPDLYTSILSRHNIILLGLRGQAKTKIARLMINLLDEYIPVIKGSELNDDPFAPLSHFGRNKIKEMGDNTPIEWIPRDTRYTEKLATPDVTISDLIGDVDPIKAASLKLPYSDERVIHFGLIPRSHRSIFVINELPDLQARIQVALFNILQEEDIQIRGFKVRLPLDVQFIFTANPEDYTNRGAIVTPLKDRIDSQILTHYPKSIEISKRITEQESKLADEQKSNIVVPELVKDLIEQVAFEARESEYVDIKSGVSARLAISAYENIISTAERRRLLSGEKETFVRISDFVGVIPSITGKVELVYEGEQEGPAKVAHNLISKSIKFQFAQYFPSPDKVKRQQQQNPYQGIINWFNKGNKVDILTNFSLDDYKKTLGKVPGLSDLVKKYNPKADETNHLLLMEFALHGLAEYSLLSKYGIEYGLQFKDMLSSMFTKSEDDDFEDFDDEASML